MAADQHNPLGAAIDWHPVALPGREILPGAFVVLRPVDPVLDAEPLYEASHPPGDDSIWTYLPTGPYASAEALQQRLREIAESDDPLFFTLVRLPREQSEGMASYLRMEPEHGSIEIGHIWFGVPLQRTPAATEAIYLLLRHAFDDLGYRRMEWKCNALNAASRRAAERFGFTFEGVFRQHMVVKGRNRDTAWYAITDQEWPPIRAGFQKWLAEDNFGPDGGQRHPLSDLIAQARAAA